MGPWGHKGLDMTKHMHTHHGAQANKYKVLVVVYGKQCELYQSQLLYYCYYYSHYLSLNALFTCLHDPSLSFPSVKWR